MKKIFVIILVIFLTGCASFVSYDRDISTLREDATYRINIEARKQYNGHKSYFNIEGLKLATSEHIKIAASNHNFKENEKNPKYDIDIVVEASHNNCLPCAFITGLSWFVIPSWETIYITMFVNVKDNRTGKNFSFVEKGRYRNIMHILAVFALAKNTQMAENILFTEMTNKIFNRIITEFETAQTE